MYVSYYVLANGDKPTRGWRRLDTIEEYFFYGQDTVDVSGSESVWLVPGTFDHNGDSTIPGDVDV